MINDTVHTTRHAMNQFCSLNVVIYIYTTDHMHDLCVNRLKHVLPNLTVSDLIQNCVTVIVSKPCLKMDWISHPYRDTL